MARVPGSSTVPEIDRAARTVRAPEIDPLSAVREIDPTLEIALVSVTGRELVIVRAIDRAAARTDRVAETDRSLVDPAIDPASAIDRASVIVREQDAPAPATGQASVTDPASVIVRELVDPARVTDLVSAIDRIDLELAGLELATGQASAIDRSDRLSQVARINRIDRSSPGWGTGPIGQTSATVPDRVGGRIGRTDPTAVTICETNSGIGGGVRRTGTTTIAGAARVGTTGTAGTDIGITTTIGTTATGLAIAGTIAGATTGGSAIAWR